MSTHQVLSSPELRKKYDQGQRKFTAADFDGGDDTGGEGEDEEVPLYTFDESMDVDQGGWGYAWKLKPDGSRERVICVYEHKSLASAVVSFST